MLGYSCMFLFLYYCCPSGTDTPPADSNTEFSQFQTSRHPLPLWLLALKDFFLHFVPAQWHGSGFTLPRRFLSNSLCFALVLIDFTPLILNIDSFIRSKKLRQLTSHYFWSIFHVSFILLPIFSHPCLWNHWAKVVGTTKLTSFCCTSLLLCLLSLAKLKITPSHSCINMLKNNFINLLI